MLGTILRVDLKPGDHPGRDDSRLVVVRRNGRRPPLAGRLQLSIVSSPEEAAAEQDAL